MFVEIELDLKMHTLSAHGTRMRKSWRVMIFITAS
jgi:hypothetical protein